MSGRDLEMAETKLPSELAAQNSGTSANGALEVLPKVRTPPWRQFDAVMRKNFVHQLRQGKSNCVSIIAPLCLVLLLLLIQEVGRGAGAAGSEGTVIAANPHPKLALPNPLNLPSGVRIPTECSKLIKGLPEVSKGIYLQNQPIFFAQSQPSTDDSIGIYAPPFQKVGVLGNVTDTGFVKYVKNRCGYIFLSSLVLEDVQKNSKAAVDSMLYKDFGKNPRLGGYLVNRLKTERDGPSGYRGMDYSIYINKTVTLIQTNGAPATPLMDILVDAFYHTGSLLELFESNVVGTKNFPSPERTRTLDIVTFVAPFFYILIFQLMLPLILGGIVYEKEQRLRQIMKMMGLRDVFYWITAFSYNFILFMISSLMVVGLSAALGFRYLLLNDFLVVLLILVAWGFCMVALCAMVSVFFGSTRAAHVFGYILVFVISFVASLVIGPYFSQDAKTTPAEMFAIQLLPTFSLYRTLLALQENVANNAAGIRIGDLGGVEFRVLEVMIFHIVEGILFLAVLAYLEQVWPNAGTAGVQRDPVFCFRPSFWKGETEAKPLTLQVNSVSDEPSDIAEERSRVNRGNHGSLVVLKGLSKTYPASGGNPAKLAVNNITLGIPFGTCFGFLGPNGAGKTTLVNMLSGLIHPSAGTATIGGFDIRKDLDCIHAHMGVCNQDNLLWGDLTGREHLLFYGRLANLSGSELKAAVDQALIDVGLEDSVNHAGRKKAKEYSGGMKRRLSVACALIGNRRIILLDEPTTGLDPASRQQLWAVIKRYKQSSAVLLTTHSMEEADELCNSLSIVSNGELKCVGPPSQLKVRFGKGYRVTIKVSGTAHDAAVKEFVENALPGAELLNSLAGTSNFEVPRGSVNLANVFKRIAEVKDRLSITDWGITSTTLEEVFLRIVFEEGDET